MNSLALFVSFAARGSPSHRSNGDCVYFKGGTTMRKTVWTASVGALVLLAVLAASYAARKTFANYSDATGSAAVNYFEPAGAEKGFSVGGLIGGRPATGNSARGRRCIGTAQRPANKPPHPHPPA